MKHCSDIEIRFADMDSLGHVNNAKYLTYFEQARIKYLDSLLGTHIKYEKDGVILASAKIDFKFPVTFKHKARVYSEVTRVGNKSFDITSSLTIEIEGKEMEACSCLVVLVCFDYANNVSVAIPEAWRKLLI